MLGLAITDRLVPWLGVALLVYGLLSDVFDGIVARRLGVSTEHMRRLDSSIDGVFYLSVAAAVFMMHPTFVDSYKAEIIILVASEAVIYLVSYLRFGKEVATHAIASKVWSLFLFATLAQVILTGDSGWLFKVCFWGGLVTRLEILLILFIIREWTNDVPSVLHALKLRQGKVIKRNKLFNG